MDQSHWFPAAILSVMTPHFVDGKRRLRKGILSSHKPRFWWWKLTWDQTSCYSPHQAHYLPPCSPSACPDLQISRHIHTHTTCLYCTVQLTLQQSIKVLLFLLLESGWISPAPVNNTALHPCSHPVPNCRHTREAEETWSGACEIPDLPL